MDYCVILTTTPNIDEAKKIAHCLVEKKLAACVNIIPEILSIYEWEEKINEDEEYLLLIKSRKSVFNELKDAILDLHSYDLPEIIMLPVEEGYKNYLDWIKKNTNK